MKWYHYVACFFAGVFLIHVIPHLIHGVSVVNIVGALISLGGGCLLLWVGKFSLRNPWAILLLRAGMASVLVVDAMHHHRMPGGSHASENSGWLSPVDAVAKTHFAQS
jgi:hypothetical protein